MVLTISSISGNNIADTSSQCVDHILLSEDYKTHFLSFFCLSQISGAKQQNLLYVLLCFFYLCMQHVHYSSIFFF